jgi:hypothetical protein
MGFEGYSDDSRPISWTDGSPQSGATNNRNGLYVDYGTYVSSGRNGFSFTAPADGTLRTLTVHVGGWSATNTSGSGGTLTAHLSDASAPDFVDSTAPVIGSYDRNYTLTYKAGAPGQTLTITWAMGTGAGTVSLSGAALAIAPIGGGTLSGSGNSLATTANLTAEGTADWIHWGDAALNRKSGVTALISNYTVMGSGSVPNYSNDPRALSWTDGTPTPTGSNNNGVYINSLGNGFSFTAPADTSTRILTVHVGGWLSGGTLTAHLSDNSATDFVDSTTPASGQYDRNYTLTYSAASAGKLLTVTWVATSGAGNVTMNGAALSSSGSTITATAGATQSAPVTTAFATALQATVKDSSNHPLSGISVTFAAPATGPSGVFAGPTPTVVTTDANGIATAPTFTANGQVGSYTVTATAPGASAAANFNLTNVGGPPASITATLGTPQSAMVNTAFPTALQATVKDASNNLLSGIQVTFTAPASGASATFSGSASLIATTNLSGVAIAPGLTANSQTGGYTVTASAPGVATLANFSLTNTASGGGGGVLTGSGTSAATTVSLTTEGTTDWIHWGDGVLNRKNGVTAQISDYSVVGSGPVIGYNNDPRTLSWSDGTPTASGSNANGWYINSLQNGFSFIVPADASTRVLTVHVGGWFSGGTLTAHLSDNSAADFIDSTSPVSGQYDRNYTLTYNAASAGKTLTVKWVATSGGGNVTLNGAALSLVGGSIAVSTGSSQSATVNSAFATPLQAIVKDSGNHPVSGVTVTFTPPASGPGGVFTGPVPATAVTNASGIATAPTFTANGQVGAYVVAASAPGAGSSASFNLTNLAGPPASIAATIGTPQSTAINTGFATALQATVKDASNNLLSGITVTFTVPASGASASFGGLTSVTASTNSSGVATAPALTANGQPGTYTVTASAPGVATLANFSLTNISGTPGSITATGGSSQSAAVNTAFGTTLQATVKDASNNPLSGITVTFTAPSSGASGAFGGSLTTTATTNGSGVATAAVTANTIVGAYTVTASAPGVATPANFSLTNTAGSAASITASGGTPQSATVNTTFGTTLQATVKDSFSNVVSGVVVTFTAPNSGASGTFGGSLTSTATTNASGVATAPVLTANGQAGSYAVTASAPGVAAQATFSLTNSTVVIPPVKLIQGNTFDSLINLQSATVAFKSSNTAGNWIGVVIYGGQTSSGTFTITDSNGNVYHPALTTGNQAFNTTLAIYYAENIKAGANTVKIVPGVGGYLRIAIVEYSGIATVNSLDVTVGASGGSTLPSSGTATTTVAGDLLLGAGIFSNGQSITAGSGYTMQQSVPASPSTKLFVEDRVQAAAGATSATATLGSTTNWAMGMAAFKTAH